MARFDMRRTRDGALRTAGPVPDDHYFSAKWIAERLAAGEATVEVTVDFADGPQTWQLAGLEGEDRILNTAAWHLTREGGKG